MPTTTRTTTIVSMECSGCGVIYGLSEDYCRQRQEDHGIFHCPNGHRQFFTGQTEAQKLRQSLEYERTRVDYWKDEHAREKRQHSATKGQLTKARRRIGRGVCPCCNRSFPALADHMRTDHPEVADG